MESDNVESIQDELSALTPMESLKVLQELATLSEENNAPSLLKVVSAIDIKAIGEQITETQY
ncbi:MAG: hypothetical protein ACOX7F_03535 [Eubacteriales bacterium]